MADEGGRAILDLLQSMTSQSMQASSLDEDTLMLVRIGALVAVDAPAASYLLNVGAASEVGVSTEQVEGVLAAVAPIVGAPRVASAVTHMAQALGMAIDLGQAS